MQKFHDIIKHLSIIEKIDLLLSSKSVSNATIANYELPVIESITDAKILTNNLVDNFHFLGSTWNIELIRNFGKMIGYINHHNLVNFQISTLSNNENFFSSNNYLTGKIVGSLLNGIESMGSLTAISCIPNVLDNEEEYYLNTLLPFDIAIRMSSPFMMETTNPQINKLVNMLGYKGYVAYKELEENSLTKALNNQALFVTSNNKEYIISAINQYKLYQEKLLNGEISKANFDKLEREGIIFDVNKLDQLVVNLLEALSKYDEITTSQTNNELEINLDDYYNESIFLLKNNNALPLNDENNLLIGRLFEDNYSDNSSLLTMLNNYSINVTGFVRGYYENIETNTLFSSVKNELDKANYNNIILLVESINGNISSDIMELIKKVYNDKFIDSKLILVVTGDNMLKVKLDDYCDALLFIPKLNNKYAKALLDTLVGKNNPSAHVSYLSYENTDLNEENEKPIYPLGYGLSYSKFIYTNEELTKTSIKFTIENSSLYDGYELVQIYTKCPFEEKLRLAGFKKIFLHANEKKSIIIPLDDIAFRYYDIEKKLYGIKAGIYEVYLANNSDEIIWSNSVELSDYINDKNEYKDELLEESDNIDTLTDFMNKSSIVDVNANHKMSFSKKLTIGIITDLYFSFRFLFHYHLKYAVNTLITIIVLASLIFITNIFFAIYLVLIIRNRHDVPNEFVTTNDMVNNTTNFKEIARVVYEKPVIDEETMEEIVLSDENKNEDSLDECQQTNEDSVQEETDILQEEHTNQEEYIEIDDMFDEEDYDDSYVAKPITYEERENYQNLSLDDLCVKFNSFALESGYILELAQVRALLAAVLSNKMIFINSNNNEQLIGLLSILDQFFGNEQHPLNITEETTRMKDILWVEEEDVYTYSDFTIDLLTAKNNKNGLKLFVINNVNMEKFPKYFYKFIRQASTPRLQQYIKLEKTYELPSNVCYFIIPNQENYIDIVSSKLMESTLSIYMNIAVTDIKQVPIEPVSYKKLLEQIDEIKNLYFLDEDDWKKLDDLEDEIHQRDKSYSHTNLSALLVERFCTILLSLDADRNLLDDVLAMYYIPLIKSSALYKKTNGDLEIKDILNQIFGSDNIPNALKILPKYISNPNDEDDSNQNESIIEANDVNQQ